MHVNIASTDCLRDTGLITAEPSPQFQRADITPDARLLYVSEKSVSHPTGVAAREFSMCAPLINGQRKLAQELRGGAGAILPLTRSSIAQLGIELDVQTITLTGSLMRVEGYALSSNGDVSERLIERAKEMLREHMEIMIGRVGLLPVDARIGLMKRLRRAVDRGRLASDSLRQMPDRSVLLNVGSVEYLLPENRANKELFDSILMGRISGRKVLEEARDKNARPDILQPGQFMVTDLDIGSQSHHVVLRPELVDLEGNPTSARHHRALWLDAGRTQASKGKRHAEIWNLGREAIDLRSVRLRADLYRPAEIQDPGH